MQRIVSASLVLDVESDIDAVLAVVPMRAAGLAIDETLKVLLDKKALDLADVDDEHGTRLHRAQVGPGRLTIRYDATVDGKAAPLVPTEAELIRYCRPSRYCESDALSPTANAEFSGLEGMALLDAVSSWVGTHLEYVPGSSLPTDGAVRTLLSRQGVCRDYAHLCIALLRARDVPARLVSVYAPGLDPMDFHAVCEAYIDGRWLVVDATALAPRESLLRIATGRDAADTAFLTTLQGLVELVDIEVTATVDQLPNEDARTPVQLG